MTSCLIERLNQHQSTIAEAVRDAQAERIMAMLDENGDITLAEIQSGLSAQGAHVGVGTLWRFFDRRGVTRKKRMARPACKQDFTVF